MKRVCVYCGSRLGDRPEYRQLAAEFGRLMVEHNLALVYGGGHVGLMGVIADAVLAHGGTAIGVITDYLVRREVAHTGLTELYVVNSMHERKAMMADMADAFVALPGGYGTLDELFEIITWAQLGLHDKPCLILNTQSYFEPLLQFIDGALDEGFIAAAHRELLLVRDDPREVAEFLSRLELSGSPGLETIPDPR